MISLQNVCQQGVCVFATLRPGVAPFDWRCWDTSTAAEADYWLGFKNQDEIQRDDTLTEALTILDQ